MLMLAWTTVAARDDATRLATSCVTARLAACAQIDGPITSIYHWEGRIAEDQEYRITFKFVPANLGALEAQVLREHPYSTPEWIVCASTHVTEKYLSWARTSAQP